MQGWETQVGTGGKAEEVTTEEGPVAAKEPVEVGKKLEVISEAQVSLRPLDLGTLIVDPAGGHPVRARDHECPG